MIMMKTLDNLEIICVSGGETVKAGSKWPGYVFNLFGDCNITVAGNPSEILWDGSDMVLGVPYEVTVETTQFGDFHYINTYQLTKHHDHCEFFLLSQK